MSVEGGVYTCIHVHAQHMYEHIELVDSICRDGTDMPISLTNEAAQISRMGQLSDT